MNTYTTATIHTNMDDWSYETVVINEDQDNEQRITVNVRAAYSSPDFENADFSQDIFEVLVEEELQAQGWEVMLWESCDTVIVTDQPITSEEFWFDLPQGRTNIRTLDTDTLKALRAEAGAAGDTDAVAVIDIALLSR